LEVSVQAAPGVSLYFSTDGSVPTADSKQIWRGGLTVTNTTILRLAAFKGGRLEHVQTVTYLFPGQVAQQTGAGFPAAWGSTNGNAVVGSYGMAPEIINDLRYRDQIQPALKALPTISVVMDPGDLFDPQRGIYSNPQESGLGWERPASVELIFADGRAGFQVDCGIRIQGGWNRRPEESPKHAFRLVFNKRYGAGQLNYPLFGDTGVREFETLILRAGCNNSWLHWSGEERRRGDYIRDQWMRETLAAMGHLSARGLFVHLYLNGLYWGIYNLVERPSAPFIAANLGGSPKQYDCRNGEHILEGSDTAWKNLMRLIDAGVAEPRHYEVIDSLVDLPEFIDYMLANLYGANADWDRSSNWYAARRRKPAGKFQFYVWDGERTLEGVNDNILDFDDDESPPRLFQRLRQNPQFRTVFAEHVRRDCFGNGALTPEAAAARYRFWSSKLDAAVVAESARWGNYRRDLHQYKTGPYEVYTRDDHWRPEVDRLLREYFPKRTAVLVEQLRAAGLFPAGELNPSSRNQ
jgi:hypothetical protein